MTPFKKNVTESIDNLNRICKTILSVYDNETIDKMLNDNVLNQSGSDLTFNNTVAGGKFEWEIQGSCEQDGTPTPTEPIDVKVVTGDNDVVVQNKNLIKIIATSITVNNITFTVNNDGTILVNGTASGQANLYINNPFYTEENENYVLSGCPSGGSINTYSLWLNENGVQQDIGNGISFTTSSIENQRTYLRIRIQSGTVCNNLLFKPMLEKGSIKTEFVKHAEQKVTLHLGTNYLAGIGEYVDTIEGKTDDWKIARKMRKVVLDGTETFGTRINNVNTKQITCILSSSVISNIVQSNQLCNYGIFASNTYNSGTIGKFLLSTNRQLFVCVDDSETETTFANKLQNNNLVIYTPISEIIEEPITDTTLISDLNNMYNLMGYDGQTNISIVPAVENATPSLKVTGFVTEKEV